jgi:VanZ family protein
MLKIVTITILLFIPVSSFADDNFALHLGLSTVFGAAGESYLHYKTNLGTSERIVYGTIIGIVPGFAKEVIDSTQKDNSFSGTQMAVNVLGALIGSVIANTINNNIQLNIEKNRKRVMVSLLYRF